MLAERLRKIRKERGLTLGELAKLAGTSAQNIHRYENGQITNVPLDRIEAMAAALGVAPAELAGWDSRVMPVAVKRLPVLGEIACGQPIFANEEYGSFVTADSDIDADFCLRARGDSMVGARIFDGDVVFIRSQSSVNNGEVAAVIIGDEATLKRVYFYPEKNKLILSPENPKYEPQVYIGEELDGIKILGRAVAFHSRIR